MVEDEEAEDEDGNDAKLHRSFQNIDLLSPSPPTVEMSCRRYGDAKKRKTRSYNNGVEDVVGGKRGGEEEPSMLGDDDVRSWWSLVLILLLPGHLHHSLNIFDLIYLKGDNSDKSMSGVGPDAPPMATMFLFSTRSLAFALWASLFAEDI
ncbi:hypothetical protein PIB30_085762 [Stylosanthes scabra]|uniref:Uncharacterized protein n=1 Tax=Stylosanthes scabra TaxID=79078 RepID=A0ABU6TSE6_9FABA|nr:hypothetical protein [Stylosanthes scabra]